MGKIEERTAIYNDKVKESKYIEMLIDLMEDYFVDYGRVIRSIDIGKLWLSESREGFIVKDVIFETDIPDEYFTD